MQVVKKMGKVSDESVQYSSTWNDWLNKEGVKDPSCYVTTYWGAQNRTQRCGLTSAEWGKNNPPNSVQNTISFLCHLHSAWCPPGLFLQSCFPACPLPDVLLHGKETKKLSWKSQNNHVSWTYMKDPAYNMYCGIEMHSFNKIWGGKQIMTLSKRFCVERKAKTKPRKEKKMLSVLFLYH